ncbi:MAG: sigma-70 family RNA polymerase sigma factor [Planctomycetota bacterium]
MPPKEDVTRLLADLSAGKKGAAEALMPLLYDELRALARHYMRGERVDHTLQTTALVHEAYLRLGGKMETAWENKAHYMRVAARAMRHVLIDHARRKRAAKKGGTWKKESLDKAAEILEEASIDLLAVDQALSDLAKIDEQMAQVVELKFFGGLTIEETANVLGISPSTVKHEWVLAKAWLRQQIG